MKKLLLLTLSLLLTSPVYAWVDCHEHNLKGVGSKCIEDIRWTELIAYFEKIEKLDKSEKV